MTPSMGEMVTISSMVRMVAIVYLVKQETISSMGEMVTISSMVVTEEIAYLVKQETTAS